MNEGGGRFTMIVDLCVRHGEPRPFFSGNLLNFNLAKLQICESTWDTNEQNCKFVNGDK